MSEKRDGGPAFPQDLQGRRGDDPHLQGMSLRDWFAGLAMEGLIESNDEGAGDRIADVPYYAYDIADAMLKAREASDD